MKKLITTLVAGALLLSSSFAQLSQMSFGVRGSLGVSDMTIADETKKGLGNELNAMMIKAGFPYSSSDVDNKPIVGGGFALWATTALRKFQPLACRQNWDFCSITERNLLQKQNLAQ